MRRAGSFCAVAAARLFYTGAILVVVALSTVHAQDNYTTWSHHVPIVINTSATSGGASVGNTVTNFPLLIRLDTSNFKDFAQTLAAGGDIRFSKADYTKHLPYQIERWISGPTNNDTAEIWVLVDSVRGNNAFQNVIVMHYGKTGAFDSSKSARVFSPSNGFTGVYHLAEAERAGQGGTGAAGYYKDATGLHNGTDSIHVTGRLGVIGNGHQVDSTDQIPLGMWDPSATKITLSAWVYWNGGARDSTHWNTIIAKRNTYQAGNIRWQFNYTIDASAPYTHALALYDGATSNGQSQRTFGMNMVSAKQWHHLMLTSQNGAAKGTKLYIDGVKAPTDTTSTWGTGIATPLRIGRNDLTTQFWGGYLDEVRIDSVIRSADWARLSFYTQKSGALCVALAPVIVAEPKDTSVNVGQLHANLFSVNATGTNLTYAWYKGSAVSGTPIAGKTGRVFTLDTIHPADTGYYICRVSNFFGSDTSRAVHVRVLNPLTNPLSLALQYNAGSDSVTLTLSNLNAVTWSQVASVKISYSIAGGTYVDSTIAAGLLSPKSTYAKIFRNAGFTGEQKTVVWQALLTGTNGLPSPIVTATDTVGTPRPTNTIVLKVNSGTVQSDRIGLYWARLSAPVDSVRIWYGTAAVPVGQWNIQGSYSKQTIRGSDTSLLITGLTDSTTYYFGAQVLAKGLWSVVTAASSVSQMTLPTGITQIKNKAVIDSITFDMVYNRLYLFWHVDTSGIAMEACIVWSKDFTMPEPRPPFSFTAVTNLSRMIDTIPINPPMPDFATDYYFGIYVRKPGGQASPPRDSLPSDSSIKFYHVPIPKWQSVSYFYGADTVYGFGGNVVFVRASGGTQLNVNATLHLQQLPIEGHEFIPVSIVGDQVVAFSLDQPNVTPLPLLIGLHYNPTLIPVGTSPQGIRMYHYDTTGVGSGGTGAWLVDTNTLIVDSATSTVYDSIPDASSINLPFVLLIDTVKPSIDVSSDIRAPVSVGQSIPFTITAQDNVANLQVSLFAGRGDDMVRRIKTVRWNTSQANQNWVIPANLVEGNFGVRALIVASDGWNSDTEDVSRNVVMRDSAATSYTNWSPIGATSILTNQSTASALYELTPGKTWKYDNTQFRLFRWSGTGSALTNWMEYSVQGTIPDSFSFIPGRLMWLKTRLYNIQKIDLGAAQSVPLKTFPIRLAPKGWTDLYLPFRFDIRIRDILDSTGLGIANDSLLFYSWQLETEGVNLIYFTSPIYLPGISDPVNIFDTLYGDSKKPYSIFNALDTVVILRIPAISVSGNNAGLTKTLQNKKSTWNIAVRPWTADSRLSPVYCAYAAGGSGVKGFPVSPSWSRVSVGVYDADMNKVFGHLLTHDLNNGGYVFNLVFENAQAFKTRVNYSVASIGPLSEGIKVAVIDPSTGASKIADSTEPQSVMVEKNSKEYRLLAVGTSEYLNGIRRKLPRNEFALIRISPNPARSMVKIEYSVPYSGIEKILGEVINQLGQTIWTMSSGNNLHPGTSVMVWNPAGHRRTAAGSYIIRITGYNGSGIAVGQKLSKVMYLP